MVAMQALLGVINAAKPMEGAGQIGWVGMK